MEGRTQLQVVHQMLSTFSKRQEFLSLPLAKYSRLVSPRDLLVSVSPAPVITVYAAMLGFFDMGSED